MWLGRYALGEELVVPFVSQNAAGTPLVADVLPWLCVYAPDGSKVLSGRFSPIDPFHATGLWQYRTLLDSRFALGRYRVALGALVAAAAQLDVAHFEIVGGGDAAGAVVSMYWTERPPARVLVQRTDGGARLFARNPSL